MFYQENMDEALRFGDVVKGFIITTPNINKPFSTMISEDYSIEINMPTFSVVVSPCCSIGDKIISLTPLIKLRNTFFDNPFFQDDLTRINRQMEPENTLPPDVWKKLSDDEREKRLEKGLGYAFLELFIYEQNDLFPKYTIHRKRGDIETNYYMIDFRDTYKLNCEKIITPKNSPLDSKCLQLSVQTRAELRDKISYYYARVPQEDEIALGI